MNSNSQKKVFIFSGVALGALLLFAGRKEISKGIQYLESEISDLRSRNIINKLHPAIKEKAGRFIIETRKRGIPMIMTSGLRDFAEQQILYNQGRTTPGAIITNAKPGDSFHNYALAFDAIPNVSDWKNYPRYNEIVAIAESLGLRWGGNFKTILDKPHFEIKTHTISELKKLWKDGKHYGNYVRLAA